MRARTALLIDPARDLPASALADLERLGITVLATTGYGLEALQTALAGQAVLIISAEGAGLHGVSLYAPHVAPGHDFGAASHFYEKFVFVRDTLWRDLVRALALPNVCC